MRNWNSGVIIFDRRYGDSLWSAWTSVLRERLSSRELDNLE